jgi:phage gpG-like protein
MNQFGFDKVIANMERAKAEIPPIIANLSQNFFVESFNKQGFTYNGLQAWKQRVSTKDAGRAILVKSGRLKRAVGNSVQEATFEKIRLGVSLSDVPYAQIHNEGGETKNATIPKREYMGDSPELRLKQINKIKQMLDKIWQV